MGYRELLRLGWNRHRTSAERYHVFASGAWAGGQVHDSFTFVDSLDEAKAWVVDYVATRLGNGGTWVAGADDTHGIDPAVDPDGWTQELVIEVCDGAVVLVWTPEVDELNAWIAAGRP